MVTAYGGIPPFYPDWAERSFSDDFLLFKYLDELIYRPVLYPPPPYPNIEFLFGFVAVEQGVNIPTEEGGVAIEGPGTAAHRVHKFRVDEDADYKRATREIGLDCIDAYQFMSMTKDAPKCDINNDNHVEKRKRLHEELLAEANTGVLTVLFSQEDEVENSYIANFQPSTWHRLIVTKADGLPAEYAEDFSSSSGEGRRLLYAAPVTYAERDRLFEIISLNHIPDIGL